MSSKRERKTGDSKTTRVRTVLNEKQLHTLRTCYNANPRPDALMKEQLVEMTGLSPRVVRVWFQNKRCKDKKREIYLKQMQEQGKVSGLWQFCLSSLHTCDQEDIRSRGTSLGALPPVSVVRAPDAARDIYTYGSRHTYTTGLLLQFEAQYRDLTL